MRNLFRINHLYYLGVVICLLLSWGCEGGGKINENIMPKTRLANVPPDNFISQNPRLTLYWIGDDPDGYVVGFRYRWSFRTDTSSPFQYKAWSTILNIGIDKNGTEKFALMTDAIPDDLPQVYKYFATLPPEGIDPLSADALDHGDTLLIEGRHVWASNPTTELYPVHVNPNSGTFIFDSQDSLNPHTFEVSAIDNNGAVDLVEAKVYFNTPKVPGPIPVISKFPGDTVLIADKFTDTFTGIEFGFQGFDPNSRTVEYSWVIDLNEWPPDSIPWSSYTQSTRAFVTAANFVVPKDTARLKHTLYVRARNEFGTISTVLPQKDFYAIYPKFLLPGYPKRTLIINANFEYPETGSAVYPSRAAVDSFYASVFDAIGRTNKYDFHYVRRNPDYFPSLGVFANYSSVYFCADVISFESFDGRYLYKPQTMIDYCQIGGNMILSGWDIPYSFRAGPFLPLICHIQDVNPRTENAFTAAIGDVGKGYPDANFDPVKIDTIWHGTSSLQLPALQFIWAGRPSGFGEIIYRFQEDTCQAGFFPPNFFFCNTWNGRTIGVRYNGITYNVVYLGFSLYYVQKSEAIAILQKAFQDIGE